MPSSRVPKSMRYILWDRNWNGSYVLRMGQSHRGAPSFQERFSVAKYGSKANALRAAKLCRDAIEADAQEAERDDASARAEMR